MKVHRPLTLAGRSGRERDEGDVVGGRVGVGEVRWLSPHEALERIPARGPVRAEANDPTALAGGRFHRRLAIRGDAGVGERKANARLVGGEGQLARPEERHRTHDDSSRLQNGEPARRHHRTVVAAQEDTIPRNETQVVRPSPSWKLKHRLRGAARGDGAVEELGGAVQSRRIRDLRDAVVAHLRPQLARRQRIPAKGVDVGRHSACHPEGARSATEGSGTGASEPDPSLRSE